VTVCVPTVRLDSFRVAWPSADSGCGGRATPSTVKVTVPVGVPVPGELALTAAVTEPLWP